MVHQGFEEDVIFNVSLIISNSCFASFVTTAIIERNKGLKRGNIPFKAFYFFCPNFYRSNICFFTKKEKEKGSSFGAKH
jgi:hypothetical protein